MERTRAQRRYNSRRKALRKRRITKEVYLESDEHPYYDNLHQFSKNKIHCSCPDCQMKSRDYPKHTDLQKKEAMDSSMKDLEEVEESNEE